MCICAQSSHHYSKREFFFPALVPFTADKKSGNITAVHYSNLRGCHPLPIERQPCSIITLLAQRSEGLDGSVRKGNEPKQRAPCPCGSSG